MAATNPCPCGWYGDLEHDCSCTSSERQRYWGRLSGPLLDRIDLQVVMQRVPAEILRQGYGEGGPSHPRNRRPASPSASKRHARKWSSAIRQGPITTS